MLAANPIILNILSIRSSQNGEPIHRYPICAISLQAKGFVHYLLSMGTGHYTPHAAFKESSTGILDLKVS